MIFFVTPEEAAQFQRLDASLIALLFLSFSKKNKSSFFLKEHLSFILHGKSPDFLNDWKKYSEPEVSSLLEQCHTLVLSDLGKIKKETHDHQGEVTLTIPKTNWEAWLRMLSVARFTVAQSLQEKKSAELLFQQDFLTLLQQCLVEAEAAREN